MASPALKEGHSGKAKALAALRQEMVERNIAARGVRDELVLDAMRKVPRELFLPRELREFAYEDSPLPDRRASRRFRSPISSPSWRRR